MSFLGVTALLLSSAFTPLSSVQNASAASNAAIDQAASVSTDPVISYTVQSGDTLSALAQTYNTTVAAILALNPQITNRSLIYTGQVILIPENSTATLPIIPLTGASVVATPTSVSSGSKVQVSVSGFPAKTVVKASLYPLSNSGYQFSKEGTTNANGRVIITIKLPSNLSYGDDEAWAAQVKTTTGTSLSAISNEFVVNGSTTTVVTSTFTYVVQSGDTLAKIAKDYGTTKAEIRALNPQITSSYIYAGEAILIPGYQTTVVPSIIPLTGVGPTAVITPSSGPQATWIDVELTGFPADTSVTIGLHKLNQKLIELHASALTDAYGQAIVTMRIPKGSNVNNNRVWLAQVTTNTGPSLTVNSNVFNVTGK